MEIEKNIKKFLENNNDILKQIKIILKYKIRVELLI